MIHIRWMSSVETSYSMGTMNKDDILRLTDRGMAIFKHYLPTPFRVGRNFLNPLYEDKHASCNIYYERRSDTYKMKDFGNDDYSGDCFAFVGKLNGLDCKDSKDFIQIMKIITILYLVVSQLMTFILGIISLIDQVVIFLHLYLIFKHVIVAITLPIVLTLQTNYI